MIRNIKLALVLYIGCMYAFYSDHSDPAGYIFYSGHTDLLVEKSGTKIPTFNTFVQFAAEIQMTNPDF